MNSESLWSIHTPSGHCKHPSGIDAYIGYTQNPEIVPMLGPYSAKDVRITEKEIAECSWELSQQIEQTQKAKYVVWGSLTSNKKSPSIVVLDQQKNWIPDPSARTNWGHTAGSLDYTDYNIREALYREWCVHDNPNQISHNSGLNFAFSDGCFSKKLSKMITQSTATISVSRTLNYDLWDESTWSLGAHCLAKIAFRVLCLIQNRPTLNRAISTRFTKLAKLEFEI